MKGYYEYLKDEILSFKGNYERFVDYIPEFFRLLCNLLNEKGISREDRLMINAALAYFVTPLDVIPEDIYGPAGYIDDVFICTVVLKRIESKYGDKILIRNWEDDEEDVIQAIHESYEKSKRILEDKGLKERVLKYAGLD